MNNTEYELLTKEKLIEMYENTLDDIEYLENQRDVLNSEVENLEEDVEYWRDAYHNLKEKDD